MAAKPKKKGSLARRFRGQVKAEAQLRFDPEAHEMMRSSEFLLSCAWLGLDPAEAVRRIAALAAKRRGDNSAAEPESVAVSA